MLVKNKKFIYFVFLIINVIFIVLSQSRGIYISLFICLIVFMLRNKSQILEIYKTKKQLFNIGICLLVLIAIAVFSFLIYNKGFSRGTSGRTLLWQYAIDEFLRNNKLLGSSYGMAAVNWERNWQEMIDNGLQNWHFFKDYARTINTHNIYLQQLVLHGILGVIVLVSIVVVTMKNVIMMKDAKISKTNPLIYEMIIYMFLIPFVMGLVDISMMLNLTSFMNLAFSLSYHYALCVKNE